MKSHTSRPPGPQPAALRSAPVAAEPTFTANQAMLRRAGSVGPGNRARAKRALRPLAPTAVQSKSLRVGDAGTAAEREADAVSEAMARGAPSPAISPSRESGESGVPVSSQFTRELARASGGQPLAPHIRHEMEDSLGHDLGPVRVHSGPAAAALNRSIHARAFTRGADIFVGAGQPDLASPAGRRLLGHELTHVVQQQGGGPAIQRVTDPTAIDSKAKRVDTRAFYDELVLHLENSANTQAGISAAVTRCGAVYGKKDPRFVDILALVESLARRLFNRRPVPLQDALSRAEISFVEDVARRDGNTHKLRELGAEKSALMDKVKGSSALRYRGSKARIDELTREGAAARQAQIPLETAIVAHNRRDMLLSMETLLERTAEAVVDDYPTLLTAWCELADDVGLENNGSLLRRTIARRAKDHLGGEILEHYRSICGHAYGS